MSTALTMFDLTVPVMLRGFRVLDHYLDLAEAHAREHGLAANALIEARLAPDMLPLAGQIQRASDSAKGALGRLTGAAMPAFADTETSVAELRQRIANTVALLEQAERAAIDASIDRQVSLPARGTTLEFTGKDYVLNFLLPNFWFHVATAHAILRQQGVAVGKRDYLDF